MNHPIQIVPYQNHWAALYEEKVACLRQIFEGLEIFFYHIGSTSIPGCYAKPVIDILAVVSDVTCLKVFIAKLEKNGFENLGEHGMKHRRYFRRKDVHLHIFEDSDPEVERHMRFCAYLRSHSEEIKAYSELKQQLAKQFPLERNKYCAGKDSYIKKIDICAANGNLQKLHLKKPGIKKKDWGQQEILTAMDANMHLQMTYFVKCTSCWEILFEPDVTVVRSQILDDTFNYVLCAKFSIQNAKERIQKVISWYPKIPFSWWVGPLDTPYNLEEALLQEGFVFKEENIGMYLDLATFTPNSSKNLLCVQVTTLDQLQDFCSVFVSIGGNQDIFKKLYRNIPASLYQKGCSLEMYIAYEEGLPAVTGILLLHANCAGIYYVMTRPEMRKKGYGSSMMDQLLQKAKERGYFLATLQASSHGKSLYTRLGFQEACIFKEYTLA